MRLTDVVASGSRLVRGTHRCLPTHFNFPPADSPWIGRGRGYVVEEEVERGEEWGTRVSETLPLLPPFPFPIQGEQEEEAGTLSGAGRSQT